MNHDTLNLTDLKIRYLETTTFGNYTIKIEHDDIQQDSPRDWEPLSTMVCWHNNHNLGDDHGYETNRVMFHMLSGLYVNFNTDELTDKQYEQCVHKAHKLNVILPLYLYDHSGITMNTTGYSCPYDSGQSGYIFVSYEDIRKEYNVKRVSAKLRERMVKYLTTDVKTYDQYLRGEIFYFNVEKTDNDGETIDIDSCGGYYGYDDNYMISVIKDAISYDINATPQQLEMF